MYPPQRFSDIGELYPIRVGRISPEDARMLSDEGTTKLKGISYGHFGGFLQRDWRENDYLWGRFDGAERLLHLLLGDRSGQRAAGRRSRVPGGVRGHHRRGAGDPLVGG